MDVRYNRQVSKFDIFCGEGWDLAASPEDRRRAPGEQAPSKATTRVGRACEGGSRLLVLGFG